MKSLPHWLAIVLVILPAPAISSPININLYLSESMGESTLIQLLQSVEPAESMNIVLRGMATNDRNLIQTITRWQSRIQSAGVAQGVQLNPVTFREHNIERVPAITITDNGSSELIVFGVTSVDWTLRQYHAGRRGNIGTYGSTYLISEPDLLEVLLHRLQQQDWNSIQRKAQRRLKQKEFSYGVRLPTSRQSSSKLLTLGCRWRTPMMALDINDKQQRNAVISWLQQYPEAVVMISSWSLPQLQTLPSIWHQHPIYLLPKSLIKRFQLSALPALMIPENSEQWRITSPSVSEFSVMDMISWLRALISATVQPAYALETTENPSKALCQNVPILSEKLITSVPWKELFPIRIGLAKLGSGKEPNDRAKTSTGLCLCEDSAGMFHPGVTTGFWRPQRLIELTRSPGCLMALGAVTSCQ